MAVLAFVLLFVLLGARRVLPRHERGAEARARPGEAAEPARPPRDDRAVRATILVLGVAVPAAVIATDKGRDSIPEANVKQLTSLQKEGAELFGQRCRMCHTLKAANATGNVGPNLDDAPRNKALVLDAIENGRSSGNGQHAQAGVRGRGRRGRRRVRARRDGRQPRRPPKPGGDGASGVRTAPPAPFLPLSPALPVRSLVSVPPVRSQPCPADRRDGRSVTVENRYENRLLQGFS